MRVMSIDVFRVSASTLAVVGILAVLSEKMLVQNGLRRGRCVWTIITYSSA